jgi:hypothetical protein
MGSMHAYFQTDNKFRRNLFNIIKHFDWKKILCLSLI